MEKYLLQHWHLYQPRGNDLWTKIINNECYRPNAENGILSHISFDIGPTLVDWLRKHDKKTLEKIVSADHGQAIAQPYSHRIMPLIRHEEDIKTQIVWGKKHFKNLFGRNPEGMWLPETATSRRVLVVLAKEGIKYTIGAPWQKKGPEDAGQQYKIDLGNGLEITYLFYNRISGDVAFNSLTPKGIRILDNVDNALDFLDERSKNEKMLLLAYDGETFGHHHKHADKWAAYFPEGVQKHGNMKLITIKEYLDNFKERKDCLIWDNSSWSCICGGLKRWQTGCGCAGGHKLYQKPLLAALERVEDKVHNIFVNEAEGYFKDIWGARNDYMDLKLGIKSEEEFFREHLSTGISKEKRAMLKQLLAAEYHVQLSFTSCGWFFAEMGMQSENNMLDAYSALCLVKRATQADMTQELLSDLEDTKDIVYVDGKEHVVTGRELLGKHSKLKVN